MIGEWIPVGSKWPVPRQEVLVKRNIGDIRIGYIKFTSAGRLWIVPMYDSERVVPWEVTHWQSLEQNKELLK